MTTLERYAITIAESATRPKREHKASKYLDNLEDVTRAAVQPQPVPRKTMGDPGKGHQAAQAEFRRMVPIREKAEAITRRLGGNADVVAAQLAIIAKVRAKTASVDNIGRAA
jgi:methyl coenzyme M reductase subunit D